MKNNNFLGSIKSAALCSKWRIWFLIPFVIILAGLTTFLVVGGMANDIAQGINAGIDFEGGTILTVELGRDRIENHYDENVNAIVAAIEKEGVSVTYIQTTEGNSDSTYAIDFRYQNISKDATETKVANEKVVANVKALYPEDVEANTSFVSYQAISATASKTLLTRALLAVAIAAVLILIYIMIRFEPMSAIAAIIALLHDVLIMLSFTIITRMQVNSSYVAALITIIAYSINNTIIIFDRVREYKKPYGKERFNYEMVGDKAVRDTFTRSLYTTFTTLIIILILTIVGENVIREFTVPIMIGLLAGFYSSMLVATPLWCRFMRLRDSIQDKRLAKNNPALAAAQKKTAAKADSASQKDDTTSAQPKKKANTNTYNNRYHKNTKFKK